MKALKFVVKKKQPKAPWTKIKSPGFKSQQAKLNPERSEAGGIKARSASESVRMAVYKPIAELFLKPLKKI